MREDLGTGLRESEDNFEGNSGRRADIVYRRSLDSD
jgi:hypothetical protein